MSMSSIPSSNSRSSKSVAPLPLEGPSRQALEADLTRWWCEILALPSVGPHDDFFFIGGNQERGALMLQRVKRDYNVTIPTQDLYEARTIGKLADLIQIKQSSSERQCIVAIRATGSRPPLFLVHGVGGNILGFAGLARVLPADQPVYGIQAQALQADTPPLLKLEEMAAFYVRELRQVQPAGPYAFLGFSYGGLVAYEMAQQLVALGETVSFLGMLDTWQPGYMKQIEASVPLKKRILQRLYVIRMNTKKLSPLQMVPYAWTRLKSRFFRVHYGQIATTGPAKIADSMWRVRDINMIAGARYQVRPYRHRVTLFRAHEDAAIGFPEDLAWRSYAAEVEIIHLPGDHGQILAEPNLSFLARKLETSLAQPSLLTEREEFELADDGLVRPEAAK